MDRGRVVQGGGSRELEKVALISGETGRLTPEDRVADTLPSGCWALSLASLPRVLCYPDEGLKRRLLPDEKNLTPGQGQQDTPPTHTHKFHAKDKVLATQAQSSPLRCRLARSQVMSEWDVQEPACA